MLVHTAQVRGRKIAWDNREVVQHGLNADRIKFDLDAEFRCCDSYQVVLCGPSLESPKRYIPDKDMTVAVPPSLMESTGPVSTCLLGYVGGEVRVVTAQERYPLVVVESGFTGPLDPGEEQPDLWAQIMLAEAARIEAELARESAEKARADAEAKRIAAEKARETASAEAVKAANEAAAKAEQAARQAEDRVTAAIAEVAKAEQTRTEAEKARAAAESSRAEAEAARIAAESKRESAEAKRKADSAKAVADASAATSAANAAAGKADAAAQTATDGEASRVAAETARAKAEQARAIAETGRVEAEATRAANETMRTESFNTNLVSWNSKVDAACKKATDTASKAAQDAKTATDAAIAKTEEATQAAVAKAQTATDNATTAANKAETVVAQLPIPSGNVLKGEAESTFINLHDSWKAPILKGKVLGQSNQITTTGKNLVNHTAPLDANMNRPFKGEKLNNGFILDSLLGTHNVNRIAAMRVLGGIKAGDTIIVSCNYKRLSGDIEMPSLYLLDTPQEYGITINKPYTVKNNHSFVGAYLDEDSNSKMEITDFQLIKGSTPIAYEPYTGGKPSPSPDYPQEITNLNKAELVITGKNLINPNQLEKIDGNYYKCVNGQLQVVQSHNVSWEAVPIYGVLQAGIYTVSGGNIEIRDDSLNQIVDVIPPQVKQFTIGKPTKIKMKVGFGLSGYPVITRAQLEAGSKATAYEPHQSKSTPIDLQGNELRSLPNGVKDEVVIDAEGNVSLIKRVTKIQSDKLAELIYGVHPADENGNLPYVICNFHDDNDFRTHEVRCNVRLTGNLKMDKSVYASWNALVVIDTRFTDVETAKQILKSENGIYYYEATPQTIPLGKVELPALPEATSNVWNDGNIPANVYVQYLKDVNIAFADLESKLTQAVVAAAANL